MSPGETNITKDTELFVVDKSLIDRVVCAENDMLNVVDQTGKPVLAASYRQKEFLPSDNICWEFVVSQKTDFDEVINESEEE
jgi:hypothetical protein